MYIGLCQKAKVFLKAQAIRNYIHNLNNTSPHSSFHHQSVSASVLQVTLTSTQFKAGTTYFPNPSGGVWFVFLNNNFQFLNTHIKQDLYIQKHDVWAEKLGSLFKFIQKVGQKKEKKEKEKEKEKEDMAPLKLWTQK